MGELTGTTPSPDNQLIDEQVHHATLELVEGEGERKGRVFARGEFGHAVNPTANGRRYRHSIWEANFARLKKNLEAKKVLGELDHPTDGRTALQRASHVVTDLRLEGDQVIGEAEILDTAKGRDLKAILAAGVPVGISSRGFGTTKPGVESGVEEVQDDFKLVTFDFVAEPADPTAYPEAVFENAEEGVAMMFEGVGLDEDADDGDSDGPKPDDEPEPAEEAAAEPEPEPVADPEPMSQEREQELAQEFAKRVLADGEPVSEDRLRAEFAEQIVERIAALRQEVEEQVRAELMADPQIGLAATVVEQVRNALLPLELSEDASEMIAARDLEVRALSSQVEELQEQLERQEELIERLTDAAKEAGYRYHMERMLHEDDSDVEVVRGIVGDVLQFDSAQALQERVEAARNEMQAIRLQEAEEARRQDAKASRLREKNQELAEGLEESLVANRTLALELYARKRLQTHPQGAKILRVLERSGYQSKEQVDAMIEDFREPDRDPDDLEAVRARVRSRLAGGFEHLEEDAQEAAPRGGSQNYNGLGASLGELRHLAGVRDR